MYRLHIEYYNANGDQLNTGIELSEFATPLFQASAPRDLTDLCACGCRNCHWRRSLVCTVGDWVRNRASNVLLVALCLCSDFLYRSKNKVSYWPYFHKVGSNMTIKNSGTKIFVEKYIRFFLKFDFFSVLFSASISFRNFFNYLKRKRSGELIFIIAGIYICIYIYIYIYIYIDL